MTTQDSEPCQRELSGEELLTIAAEVGRTRLNMARIDALRYDITLASSENLARVAVDAFLDEMSRRGMVIMHEASADLAFKRAHPDADMGNFPISDPPDSDAEQDVRYVTDAVVFATLNNVRHVLLIRRGWPPYKGKLALPGGHVETGETSRDACARELAEETGLVLTTWQLRASGLYDNPTRDTRGRYVCVAYSVDLGEVNELPPVRGGDDAEQAVWMPVAEMLSNVASMTHALTEEDAPDALLAFDHWSIISDALANVTGSADALVGQRLPNLDPVSPEESDDGQRYMLVSDDDGHDYVIVASHEVEWNELDDDQINDGVDWAWPVGGSPTLVTFAAPLIDGDPLN